LLSRLKTRLHLLTQALRQASFTSWKEFLMYARKSPAALNWVPPKLAYQSRSKQESTGVRPPGPFDQNSLSSDYSGALTQLTAFHTANLPQRVLVWDEFQIAVVNSVWNLRGGLQLLKG
jgi:hypothetical protein